MMGGVDIDLNRPTPDEVRAALREHAEPFGNGQWQFASGYPHTEQAALDIVEVCLILGQPVTDVLTGSTFLALARAVADLQRVVKAGA